MCPSSAILASELRCVCPEPPPPSHWQNQPTCATIHSSLIPGGHPQTAASHNDGARPHKPFTMPGQLFTNYFLEEGILHTDAWQESLAQPSDFDSFRAQSLALLQNASNFHTINEASTEQELIRPLFELPRLGRLSAPARQRPQRRHPRSSALWRRRIQRPRLRQTQPESLPRRPGCRREQALQPASRRTRQDQFTARPDPPLSCHRRHQLGRAHPLGHPHQRPRLASLRPPRPSARQRLLRSRPGSRFPCGRRLPWHSRLSPALRSRRLQPPTWRPDQLP